MPWLIERDSPCGEAPLLLVHIPRCGGTSFTNQFNIKSKACRGQSICNRAGIVYFFYRYKLLETRNFPLISYESLLSCIQVVVGYVIWSFGLIDSSVDPSCVNENRYRWMLTPSCPPGAPSISLWTTACFCFICSSIFCTAPVSGRIDVIRRGYIFMVGKLLHNCTASYKMLSGVCDNGYILHWPAEKILRLGYVEQKEWKYIDNFAIVRNPYSRMVSIYMYNRYGPLETFEQFVKKWVSKHSRYRIKNSIDERDVYCHVLPQHVFTQYNGRQLVKVIIKQETLHGICNGTNNRCWLACDEFDDLAKSGYGRIEGPVPPRILKALQGMPHSNSRPRTKPWQEYYNERTIKQVYEMYREDFELFQYATTISGRPDLDSVILSSI